MTEDLKLAEDTGQPVRIANIRVPFHAVLALVFKVVMALIIVLGPMYLVAFMIWAAATGH